MLPKNKIDFRKNLWQEIQKSQKKYVHIIMIATKPDIIKQAPLYLELKKRKEFVLLIHTGQHYDYNLSYGVLQEFWMQVDINLNISGKLHEKYAMVVERLWNTLCKLIEEYWKIVIPYVHGDTMTATTADKAAFLNKCAVVHVEAGIRTFTPKAEFYHQLFQNYNPETFDWEEYFTRLQDPSLYELWSIEPYPEQFDTRGIEPSAGYYALPHAIYESTLLSEWFPKENMQVVGNTVVDAVKISQKRLSESQVFEIFPHMKWKDFLFITIHRRENCEKKERFLAIFYAIKELLKRGVSVCFLGLYASETAIDTFWLRNELDEMVRRYPETLTYGKALAHHHEVIDMISQAWAVVTDSGSLQEEANIVGTPCVTLRFGSDRSETIFHGCNIIAPPVNSELIADIVEWAIANPNMKKENIYGENVAVKIVDAVLDKVHSQGKLFQYDDERLGLEKYFHWK